MAAAGKYRTVLLSILEVGKLWKFALMASPGLVWFAPNVSAKIKNENAPAPPRRRVGGRRTTFVSNVENEPIF